MPVHTFVTDRKRKFIATPPVSSKFVIIRAYEISGWDSAGIAHVDSALKAQIAKARDRLLG